MYNAKLASAVLLTAFTFAISSGVPSAAIANEARAQAFQVLLADPNDPSAMIAYARAAAEERDYEAVVSTLERLLDNDPENAEARYELAVAYYALGSYEVAEFHFDVLRSQGLGDRRSASVEGYLEQINERTQENRLTGHVAAGIAITDEGSAFAFDTNLRLNMDLGRPNDTEWWTELIGEGYQGDSALSSAGLRLRTGPIFAVAGDAYGVRLRPYAELLWFEDDDGEDFTSTGVGLQYFNAHSAEWSSFADVTIGTYNASDGLSDGSRWAAAIGASYTPSRETRFRFTLFASERNADVATDGVERVGAKIEYRQAFAPPIGNVERRWIGKAFLQHTIVDYDAFGREDTYTSFGVSLRAFLNDDLFVEGGARAIRRNSNQNGFDESGPIITLMFGREF